MAVTEVFPTQLPQHYQEDSNASNYPVFAFGAALYLFIVDGVGFSAFGGGTQNIFVYKSGDQGVTWSNITPVAPVKVEGQFGQTFIRVGNVVYLPTGVGNLTWKMVGFDLSTELWIADGPASGHITTGLADSQQVARANGEIVNLFATAGGGQHPYLGVYDTVGATWTLDPTVIAGISNAEVLGGVLDSVGHIHFFLVVWTVAVGTGSAKLQHLVVAADNSLSAAADVYSFVHPPDFPGGAGNQVSTPVFYADVTPADNKLALAIAVPNASHVNTALLLLTAPESDTPVWTTTAVPTGEDFTAVTLGNAGVSDNSPVSSILPVQYAAQTQLQIFWTSSGSFFALGQNPWNNYFRRIMYADGVFGAVTTEFQSLNTKVTPGPVYPFLAANVGGVATVVGMMPTIDQALFFSLQTKYEALNNQWLSFEAAGPGAPLSINCGNPPAGMVGASYTATVVAVGGTAPYTFAIIAGALPTGLTLNPATGVISGIPTLVGVFVYTVQVTDSAGPPATASVICSIGIVDVTRYPSGGGSPYACPPQGCEWLAGPKHGWGPVGLVQQGKDVAVAYRARSGETFSFLLNPGWDVEQVVAAAARHIAEWERVPSGWNNPGGFTDEQGDVLQFRSMQDGYWALIEKIHENFGMRETM